ncbi:MAG: hypothetical protein BGO26_02315 [Actinobacteria bacterium 69-20]|jgi:hypothetical protein|nr:hypothetical protein [Actinomycetota bacterium]OJV31299.1 MAG: hypothetical protein BGO26_02315 [Actinobacteria bacterium 69-20]
MARTWLSVTVELLGGRGEELWPWPGRIFAVGPRHTFQDLAEAINDAFARWDRSHLSVFTLADGRVVTDEDTAASLAESPLGPVAATMDMAHTTVVRTLRPGDEFLFTFDLGDNWQHRCVVGPEKIDPAAELGIVPEVPLPYWGWGNLPDQYGRRWADDDGESRAPKRPARPHPMLTHDWPGAQAAPDLDLSAVRAAIAHGDVAAFLAAITGRSIDDALQQVAAGIPMVLQHGSDHAEAVVLSVINRLMIRADDGDQVLAEDLLARLRREPLPGRVVPVDLEMLGVEREGDPGASTGGYIDLQTGELYGEAATDAGVVGDDLAIDVDADPDRWLPFDRTGSRDGWQDMAAFAERQRDTSLRERLERAIEGAGAFRRFRDLVRDKGLDEQWHVFADDRQIGRARQFLADEGIRVG